MMQLLSRSRGQRDTPTTGATGEAVGMVQIPHGLTGLAGSIHTLSTLDTDTWRREETQVNI